ncbi:mannosyl transferase protein [Venturia nashicola]|nr:mannosyl transferase protein [Venturia nashicola]
MTKNSPGKGEYNPATLFPLILSCIFGAVLIVYFFIGYGWLFLQWRKERRAWKVMKQKKAQEQGNGSDATTDILLEELNASGRARDNEAGREVVDALPANWEDCDTTVFGGEERVSKERRPSFDLSDLVPDSPSPISEMDNRTNVRRSYINPRTHATPEVDFSRIRPDLHKSSSMSRRRSRSDAHLYPVESASLGRFRAKSDPRMGLGTSVSPPALPRNRDESMRRPSFSEHEPYPQPEFSTTGKFARTMGLKTLDANNWLTLDHQYPKYHKIRTQILDTHPNETVQILKGSEKACEELFYKVSSYLVEKYPNHFQLKERTHGTGEWAIHNLTTGEYFYTSPLDTRFSPLDICARLTQEDFNILMLDPRGGEQKLVASATLFPAAWILRERIGSTITQLHAPVTQWSTKLAPSVEKYLSRLHARSSSPDTSGLSTYDFKERSVYFVQTLEPGINVFSKSALFVQTPNAMFAVPSASEGQLGEEWIVIRRERQTFTRLERTGAIVFTVRTRVERLTLLCPKDLDGLRREVRAWPDDVATYRRRDLWGEVLLGYCDRICGNLEERSGGRGILGEGSVGEVVR